MAYILWISMNLLFSFYVGAVKNCYPGCRCEVESFGLFDSFSLTKVYCSGVGPNVAPIPIPLDTSYLDLSSNSLHNIADSMLSGPGYTTLVSLDLSNNHLSKVNRNTFSRLRYLETLDLSHNSLEDLADECFSGLPLAEVDLSSNRIQEISLDIFKSKGHGKPVNVDLSNNLLTRVLRRPQMSPLNIQSMNLSGNHLKDVPNLQGVLLRYLNLDGNRIVQIDRGAFAGLKDLLYLSLSGLPDLSVIQPHSFRGLENLQVLDMSKNPKLKLLNSEVFSGLLSLQELNLSNSGVTFLPDNMLNHLPSIRSITLRNDVRCWKNQKQAWFHQQIGQVKSGEFLICDVAGIVL
ncbi:tsukushi [Amia ocellicauda]|uniref:tsukushi n=1 Tax=Amia ocellicauda TaxID=2972642 RepID=UPI0034641AFA